MTHQQECVMRKLILLITLSLFAVTVFAATGARARLDAFANGLHSLRGNFSQPVYHAHGNTTGSSHGLLALQAPRLFRWQVTDPYQQLILSCGIEERVYESDVEQVPVRE